MFRTPEKEIKVWGRRTKIYSDGKTEVYLLDVEPSPEGKPVACSIHHHSMKYNRFFVVSGRLGVEHGAGEELNTAGSRYQLEVGDEYTVPPGDIHRFIVTEPAEIIETTWADEITEDIHRRDVGHVLHKWP